MAFTELDSVEQFIVVWVYITVVLCVFALAAILSDIVIPFIQKQLTKASTRRRGALPTARVSYTWHRKSRRNP